MERGKKEKEENGRGEEIVPYRERVEMHSGSYSGVMTVRRGFSGGGENNLKPSGGIRNEDE